VDQNFEETGSTLKKVGRTPETVARVEGALQRSLTSSARRHAVPLGISDRSLSRVLHKDLHCHTYKIQTVHALKDVDHVNRLAFWQQILNMINENPDLVNNIFMSDEAHSHLSGFVNKQNFCYWSSKTLKDSMKSRSTVRK
jgi:hypothetical protein